MTYADPTAATKDYVRFKLGDTTAPFILSDVEVQLLVDENPSRPAVLLFEACKAILGKLASRAVDKTIGETNVRASQKFEHYNKLLAQLEVEADTEGASHAVPLLTATDAGAIFDVGMHDYPGGSAGNAGELLRDDDDGY